MSWCDGTGSYGIVEQRQRWMNKWFGLILVDCCIGQVYVVKVVLKCLPYQLAAGHLKAVPELQGNCSSYSSRDFSSITYKHKLLPCIHLPFYNLLVQGGGGFICYAPSDPCGSCCVLDSDQLMVQALPTMVYVLYVSELLTSGIPMCTFL